MGGGGKQGMHVIVIWTKDTGIVGEGGGGVEPEQTVCIALQWNITKARAFLRSLPQENITMSWEKIWCLILSKTPGK